MRGTLEVIVIDSGSTDGTIEIARRHPVRIEQIQPGEFHHAKTRNYALVSPRESFCVPRRRCLSGIYELAPLADFQFCRRFRRAVYGRHLPKPGCNAERQAVLGTVYGDDRC